jgi:hypothetical protein
MDPDSMSSEVTSSTKEAWEKAQTSRKLAKKKQQKWNYQVLVCKGGDIKVKEGKEPIKLDAHHPFLEGAPSHLV